MLLRKACGREDLPMVADQEEEIVARIRSHL